MTERVTGRTGHSILSPNRIEALTDGVFAIVMTLLVLELSIPSAHEAGSGGLWEEIGKIWEDIFAYIMVFVTLGVLWLLHRFQFHYIESTDGVSLWLAIFFLASIALFPFTNSVLEYEESASVIVYSVNALASMSLLYVSWWYATSNRRLVNPKISQDTVKVVQRTPLIGIIGLIIASAISLFSFDAAILIFLALITSYVIMTAVWARRLSHRDI